MRLEIAMELLEDLHSGSGLGGGEYDALQRIDRHGRAVLRATHCLGVWKEAGRELVALGLMESTTLTALFGGPRDRRRGVLATSFRLENDGALLPWTASARRPDSRVPRDDTLHTRQHLAAGSRLRGWVELRDAALEPALLACLRHSDAYGARRRRGAGRARLEVRRADSEGRPDLPAPAAGQTRLRLLLRAVEPLCLARTGQPGNLIASESHIPGRAVWSALVAGALERGERGAAERALECPPVCGPAYPLPELDVTTARARLGELEALPFPLAWLTPKPAGQTDPAWPHWAEAGGGDLLGARGEVDSLAAAAPAEERRKRPGEHDYLYRAGPDSPWRRHSPLLREHLRNALPTREQPEGALFSLEEIAEDSLFVAELDFAGLAPAARAAFLADFAPVLAGRRWLALGREGRPVEVAGAVWCPARRHPPAPVGQSSFTLFLESDCILRDPWLRFVDSLDAPTLAGALAMPAAGLEVAGLAETIRVQGFNAASGLHRAPELGIRRGACFRVAGPAAMEARARLAALSHLGERGWEGLGRFRLDPPFRAVPAAPVENSPAAWPVEQNELLLAEARTWAADFRRRGGPSASQMGDMLARCRRAEDVPTLLAVLEGLRQDSARKASARPWALAPLDKLTARLGELPLAEAQTLLDYLLRWWRVAE